MRDRRFTYFVIGVFTGVAAGVVAGLLLAPSSGAQTRRRLALEAQRVADAARTVADRAEQTAHVLGERVEHYLGRDEEAAWRKVREIREGVQRYTQAQIS
ncbi:MAG: YtxH domain-containing protein [Coriobacteriia bacterium]|nr:YtxH domain-containing protein [Coriobacteriia bacterium]